MLVQEDGEVTIVLISDTHNHHNDVTKDLPESDIIIHAGDLTSMGTLQECKEFLQWYDKQTPVYKLFIAGNHDWKFEDDPSWAGNDLKELLAEFPDIVYLQQSSVEIKGLKIWGSPYTPRFFDWAFNVDRDKLHTYWEEIPEHTDIIVTHGPAFGHGDLTARLIPQYNDSLNVGCKALLKRIEELKPQLHVCGHIHSGSGVTTNTDTTFINASVVDERYRYAYPPKVIKLKRKEWTQKLDTQSTSADSIPSTPDTKL